jgi:hypothetical protein
MLTGRGKIGFNGECIDATGTEWRALQTLADARQLSGPAAWLAPASLRRALHAWYLCGWLQLGELNGR